MSNSKFNKSIICFMIIILCAIIGYDKLYKNRLDSSGEMLIQDICVLSDNENKKESGNLDISEESKNDSNTEDNSGINNEKTEHKEENKVKHNAKDKEDNSNKKVNINKAGVSDMVENLKGIGPSKAKLIILYRKSKGNFSSIEEIKNVKGIGDKVFDNIKDIITV